MIYTFTPAPIIDTTTDHTVFFSMCILVCLWWTIVALNDSDQIKPVAFIGIVILNIGAIISWNTGTITIPKNIQTEGTFVEFLNERHNETRSNGKTSSTVTIHKNFVVYEINGNNVLFTATPGVEYPKKAIFYGN